MPAARTRSLRPGLPGPGPVVYWLSREQRCADNAALCRAAALARSLQRPLEVWFCLAPSFLGASWRQYDFMLHGLEELETALAGLGIPFTLLRGTPPAALPPLLTARRAAYLVCDFDPLRLKRQWLQEVLARTDLPADEVDGHNIVPAWLASDKREHAAYTLRPKLRRLWPQFLAPPPVLEPQGPPLPRRFDWAALRRQYRGDGAVPPASWLAPGSLAGQARLQAFLAQGLQGYARRRNDPNLDGQSQLSPYLHFGQLAPQRAAWEVARRLPAGDADGEAFLEELIVRRELADNFCLHCPDYDTVAAFPAWARATLEAHQADPRPAAYTPAQLTAGETADSLWNAAQRELVHRGKMHGYLRMYWAKQLLTWTGTADEALACAIYLNDRYSLDGRDPNGYAGIAWSLGGVHDRPWPSRPIFGTVRAMSYAGARRKFDVPAYLAKSQHPEQA